MSVRAVFCDISEALDRVWHRGFLYKLSSLEILGSLLKWFSSYLSSILQRVVYGNASSKWKHVNKGYSGDPSFEPYFFWSTLMVLSLTYNQTLYLCADNGPLYVEVRDPNLTSQELNDLHKIHIWSKTWLVTFCLPIPIYLQGYNTPTQILLCFQFSPQLSKLIHL